MKLSLMVSVAILAGNALWAFAADDAAPPGLPTLRPPTPVPEIERWQGCVENEPKQIAMLYMRYVRVCADPEHPHLIGVVVYNQMPAEAGNEIARVWNIIVRPSEGRATDRYDYARSMWVALRLEDGRWVVEERQGKVPATDIAEDPYGNDMGLAVEISSGGQKYRRVFVDPWYRPSPVIRKHQSSRSLRPLCPRGEAELFLAADILYS